MVSHCGGATGNHPTLVASELKAEGINPTEANSEEISDATARSSDAYEAMAFLSGLNKDRYQELLDDLANSYLNGRDEYPKNLVASYKLVTNWKGSFKPHRSKTNDGVNFNIVDSESGVLNRKDGTPVKCRRCGGNHYPSSCHIPYNAAGYKTTAPPSTSNEGITNTTAASSSQDTGSVRPPVDVVTGTTNVTTSDDNWEKGWDQDVDYSALIFCQLSSSSKTIIKGDCPPAQTRTESLQIKAIDVNHCAPISQVVSKDNIYHAILN